MKFNSFASEPSSALYSDKTVLPAAIIALSAANFISSASAVRFFSSAIYLYVSNVLLSSGDIAVLLPIPVGVIKLKPAAPSF